MPNRNLPKLNLILFLTLLASQAVNFLRDYRIQQRGDTRGIINAVTIRARLRERPLTSDERELIESLWNKSEYDTAAQMGEDLIKENAENR